MAKVDTPTPRRKAGRPKGSKNRKTLAREAHQKATAKAKKALAKVKEKRGKDKAGIDVIAICEEMSFHPIVEAIKLYEEVSGDQLAIDRTKTLIELLKLLTPYTAAKVKPIQDNSTSRQVPTFNISIGGNFAPAPVDAGDAVEVQPQITMDPPKEGQD